MTEPETCSFSEFARRAGYKRSYVTALKLAGRLVLTADGKAVIVAESLARIEATRDPSKAGVVARHATSREASQGERPGGGESGGQEPEGGGEGGVEGGGGDSHAMRRSKAMADREEAAARKALREEAIEIGQLMRADQVTASIAAGVTALRVRLENLAHDLAPELAAISDELAVRKRLSDEFEDMLRELSRQFSAMGKEAGA